MRCYNNAMEDAVKEIIMYPSGKDAKITLYIRPLSDIMSGAKSRELTEEIVYGMEF